MVKTQNFMEAFLPKTLSNEKSTLFLLSPSPIPEHSKSLDFW